MKMPQGYEVCLDTWDYQGRKGYVYLSEKEADGSWRDYAFAWPSEKKAIVEWIKAKLGQNSTLTGKPSTSEKIKTTSKQEVKTDPNIGKSSVNSQIYWCPSLFKSQNGRRKTSILAGRVLYADLDPIDPSRLGTRPTTAWASSSARYQSLWRLEEELQPQELERINKRLTYYIGADKGGWDLTQVLRIPGTWNHKYDPPQKGRLLWHEPDRVYTLKDFEHLTREREDSKTQAPLEGPTLLELLARYRLQIPRKVSRLLQYPPERVEQGRRSDILWSIEQELVKAKVPIEDIAWMVRLSAWNKYSGRADEWKRIVTEITKIHRSLHSPKPSTEEAGEREEEPGSNIILPWKNYSTVMANFGARPGWLIQDIWMRRSHGMVAGEPKSLKSTIALDMAVSIASGRMLWDLYQVYERGPVIILQNENADWIITDRLEKITASKGLVGRVSDEQGSLTVEFAEDLPITMLNVSGYSFTNPDHREELESKVRAVRPVMVIFDPLYLMFEGSLNEQAELQPILTWLLYLKDTYRSAVLVVHHWNKSGLSSRGGQRMLGSTTLHGWTESALYIQAKEVPDTSISARVEIEREFRAAGILPKLDLQLTMGPVGDPTYRVTVGDAGKLDTQDLLDYLSSQSGGVSISQASKDLKMSRDKLQRLIKQNEQRITVESGRGQKGTRLSLA